MIEKLIPPAELSEQTGIPERTLSQWRYLGKGPAYVRAGRHVRYRPEAVEAWLDLQTRGGSSDAR